MKIWQMGFPSTEADYAMATVDRASYVAGPTCRRCMRVTYDRARTLIIEWDAGSNAVGDFTWANVTIAIINERVKEALHSQFSGFEPGKIEMIQDPKLNRPKRPTKRTKPRVWLPYSGPELFELRRTTWVHMDPVRTTARLTRHCEACGDAYYELIGIERFDRRVEIRLTSPRYDLIYTRVPRTPGQGLYVKAEDVGTSDFFGVHEFSGWTFCTDRAKSFIEGERFTNVEFMEMGEIV